MHRFGGDWTEQKLDVLSRYLKSYTIALSRTPFRKAYIDAFAGSGYRLERKKASQRLDETEQNYLFPDLAADAPQRLLDGSARRALHTEPPFDRYIFVERQASRCARLESLSEEFPTLRDRMEVRQGDANDQVSQLCEKRWKSHRAVLFLDPYGLQVQWSTIEAIAETRAIDLWMLFPLGIGVNRLLTRTGEIPESWQRSLDSLLGTTDWREEFYSRVQVRTLFGTVEERVEKATMDVIGRYFNNRLEQIFAGVANPPGVLRNSVNNPLYLLCFAVGNSNARDVALPIANHLLKDLR